jgi:hypothetical protein
MCVNRPMISHFDLAVAQLPCYSIFLHAWKNYAGLFWQAIVIVLMVIALIALVDS